MRNYFVDVSGYLIVPGENEDEAFSRAHKLLGKVIEQSPYEADFGIDEVAEK